MTYEKSKSKIKQFCEALMREYTMEYDAYRGVNIIKSTVEFYDDVLAAFEVALDALDTLTIGNEPQSNSNVGKGGKGGSPRYSTIIIPEYCPNHKEPDKDKGVTVKRQIVDDSIKYYGEAAQSIVCMEELAELQQAISKELRGKSDLEHLAEEMADVYICLGLLRSIYGISGETLQDWVDVKQKRIQRRMEGEK